MKWPKAEHSSNATQQLHLLNVRVPECVRLLFHLTVINIVNLF